MTRRNPLGLLADLISDATRLVIAIAIFVAVVIIIGIALSAIPH